MNKVYCILFLIGIMAYDAFSSTNEYTVGTGIDEYYNSDLCHSWSDTHSQTLDALQKLEQELLEDARISITNQEMVSDTIKIEGFAFRNDNVSDSEMDTAKYEKFWKSLEKISPEPGSLGFWQGVMKRSNFISEYYSILNIGRDEYTLTFAKSRFERLHAGFVVLCEYPVNYYVHPQLNNGSWFSGFSLSLNWGRK